MQQKLFGRLFFWSVFAFISNISHALQGEPVAQKGEKYKSKWKREENGETKKQAQRNENKEKCQIRNIKK